MATPSSILAWETPRTEEHGKLQSMGSQKSQTGFSDKTTATTKCFCKQPSVLITPRQITDGASKTLRRSYQE